MPAPMCVVVSAMGTTIELVIVSIIAKHPN